MITLYLLFINTLSILPHLSRGRGLVVDDARPLLVGVPRVRWRKPPLAWHGRRRRPGPGAGRPGRPRALLGLLPFLPTAGLVPGGRAGSLALPRRPRGRAGSLRGWRPRGRWRAAVVAVRRPRALRVAASVSSPVVPGGEGRPGAAVVRRGRTARGRTGRRSTAR